MSAGQQQGGPEVWPEGVTNGRQASSPGPRSFINYLYDIKCKKSGYNYTCSDFTLD